MKILCIGRFLFIPVLFRSHSFCQLGGVKMLFPPAVFDFYDDFQEFCSFAAYLLRLPDMLCCFTTMGFLAGKKTRVLVKDDGTCSDGLNVLQRFPEVKEANIALRRDRCLDRLDSLQNSSKDECDLALQRISASCMMNCKKAQQYSVTPSAVKQKGTKCKKSSRCKNGPKTSTPLHECLTLQNYVINNEECCALRNKVQQLEQDVILLKKQLVDVLVSRKGACVVNNNHCSVTTIHSIPPPPPPPPPPLHVARNHNIPRDHVRKAKISKESGKENHPIDMREVLKGIHSAKLKHIEKSPGGTPIRPSFAAHKQSPASSLEVALKKRLEAFHPYDSGDEEDINSSWNK